MGSRRTLVSETVSLTQPQVGGPGKGLLFWKAKPYLAIAR